MLRDRIKPIQTKTPFTNCPIGDKSQEKIAPLAQRDLCRDLEGLITRRLLKTALQLGIRSVSLSAICFSCTTGDVELLLPAD